MDKPRILFVSSYHGTRSRIAEEFVNKLAPGKAEACSSSFESGKIDPLAIAVMGEIGIELSSEGPKTVFARHGDREAFDFIVTLSEGAARGHLSVFEVNVDALFTRSAQRHHWSVPSFENVDATGEQRWNRARKIRDMIRRKVAALPPQAGVRIDIE
ncbi:MAG: hypothetical protein HXY50_17215 [Ignavibacteriaceae bacterium]|nr:hypothetical protein [Ignavibacteriaceae bacterium]